MLARTIGSLFLICIVSIAAIAGSGLEGTKAPNFTLQNIDGKRVPLSNYLEKGPVLLDFWATWCAPCKQAIPHLKKIHDKYQEKGFTLILISIDNTRSVSKVKPYIKSQKLNVPVLLDTDQQMLKRYRGNNVPHTVLIGKDGTIRNVWIGYQPGEEKEIEEAISTLIQPKENEK